VTTFVFGKLEGQNQVLKKYGLRRLDFSYFERIKALEEPDSNRFRRQLTQIEAKSAQQYFHEIFELFPEGVRPKARRTFKVYDGVNNLFNLRYQMLKWKVHIALLKAELEPYLGFLHSTEFGKPSLVCDFQELYRYLIDDFIIQNFLDKVECLTDLGLLRQVFLDVTTCLSLTKLGVRNSALGAAVGGLFC